jgi:ribose/xylose/arabinose/galactoside ABC-type transport system permease subunit
MWKRHAAQAHRLARREIGAEVGGFLQGFAITRLKVPPFVVTLGGMSAFRGAALLFAAGGPISGFEPDFVWMGQGRILGQVPVPVVIFLTFAVLAHIVLRYTRYGRQVYAVGATRKRRGCQDSTCAP